MKPVAPVTSATRDRSATRLADRDVIHPICPVHSRAHFLERGSHQEVVFENPGKFPVDDAPLSAVLQQLELDQLGNTSPTILVEHTQSQTSRRRDFSRIPER